MITAIPFIASPVTNMHRARAFYEGVLSLKPTAVTCEGKWVEYQVGGTVFAISNIQPEWTPSSQGTTVAFEVNDIYDVVSLLKAHGSTIFEDVFETPVCQMAIVSDPDGNKITIHKRKT